MPNEIATITGAVLASTLAALFGAYAVYRLGRRAYLAQKEHELVQQRYLHDGVDAVGEQFQYLLSVFHQNYEQGLNVLRYFRELEQNMPSPLLEETAYLRIESRAFHNAPHYLLTELIQTRVFHSIYQHLHAFVQIQRQFLAYDLGTYVKIHLGRLPGSNPTMETGQAAQTYLDELKRRNKEAQKYYIVIQRLQAISASLAREKFSFTDIEQFHINVNIKVWVREMQDFLTTLERDGDEVVTPSPRARPLQRGDSNA